MDINALSTVPLDEKTMKFTQGPSDIEQQFIAYQNRLQLPWLTKASKLYAVFHFVMLVVNALKAGTIFEAQALMLFLGTLVMTFSWKVSQSEWILKDNNSENLFFCATIFNAANVSMLAEFQTYSHSSPKECIIVAYPETESIQACLTHWLLIVLYLSIIPPITCLGLIWVGLVRYSKCRISIYSASAVILLRSCWLSTLPSQFTIPWVMLQAIGLPIAYNKCLRSRETESRKLFWMQFTLRGDNERLMNRLQVAEKALKFEAPTAHEQAVVDRVLGRRGCGGGGVAATATLATEQPSTAESTFRIGGQERHKDEVREANTNRITNDILFDQLELEERLAAGSFGEVIKAQYNGRVVAVKRLLRARLDEENIHLFAGEVNLLRGLNHPNIVDFLGASWDNVVNLCIVFEFMERGSLAHVLSDKSLHLTWDDPKLKMMLDAARGVEYLHAQCPPILHRDVKTDNVLVTSTFGCKITDLGSARRSESATMTQVGTPMAVAPEVMSGAYYGAPADVYSFGIMLLEVHLQRRPYDGTYSTNRIQHLVLSGKRPVIPSDVRPRLKTLIEDSWNQNPQDRPTIAEVVVRLRALEQPDDDDGGGEVVR